MKNFLSEVHNLLCICMHEDCPAKTGVVRYQVIYISTSRSIVYSYLAMAAGALSSLPPDRWLPSPLSCSFSTRWYLPRARVSKNISQLHTKIFDKRVKIFDSTIVMVTWL